MARFIKLTEREETILELAVEGLTLEEIAERLSVRRQSVLNRLQSLYRRTGLRNLHHATASYANLLGLRGEILSAARELDESVEIVMPGGQGFEVGGLRYPATLVSAELYSPNDLTCLVSRDTYQEPLEFKDPKNSMDELRDDVVMRARQRGQIVYEVPNDTLVVSKLEPDTEFYRHIKVTLKRTGYLTVRAVHDNLTLEMKRKYIVNPFYLTEAALPLPIATSVFIVAGNPPKLIVNRRGPQLATYPGSFTGTIDALGQASRDVHHIGGESLFDFKRTMLREVDEERDLHDLTREAQSTGSLSIENRLGLLGLIFDYRVMTFIIQGYLALPEVNPEALCHALSSAKEGTYEMLPFPQKDEASTDQDLHDLCDHLQQNSWTACAGIGLVIWLKRMFGAEKVFPLLGEHVYKQ